MQQRTLGSGGLTVSALGLGCMGMSFAYGTPDEAESIATVHRAIDLGIDFLDTAEIYGPYANEELLRKALAGKRDRVKIATKFGFRIEGGVRRDGVDGTPANAKRALEGSLKRLGTDFVDLYYQHRYDPNLPIEETVGAMKELVEAGKVRYLGLSEVGEDVLRRANAVHPIAALQSEYSLWERDVEALFPAMRELGTGFVPYSPLGRGFLTGAYDPSKLDEGDFRKSQPRFSAENVDANRALVDIVAHVADRKGAKPAQIALAWVLAQGNDVVPIPGTKRRTYLEENVKAVDISLDQDDLRELDRLRGRVAGERYLPDMMALINR